MKKEHYDTILNVLNTICVFYNTEYVYFITVKGRETASPIAFYSIEENNFNVINNIKITDRNNFYSQEELDIIEELIDINPDNNLIVKTNNLDEIESNESVFCYYSYTDINGNLFSTKMEWNNIKTLTYISVKINNYLNAVICLGSIKEYHQFTPSFNNNNKLLLSYSFNIVNSLFKISEILHENLLKLEKNNYYKFHSEENNLNKLIEISNRKDIQNIFNNSNEEKDPNYFKKLAEKATELLEADRTQIFVIEQGINNLEAFKIQITKRKDEFKLKNELQINQFIENYINKYKNEDVLRLIGHDKPSTTNYLIDEKKLGKVRWDLINEKKQMLITNKNKKLSNAKGKKLSENDLINAVYDIQNSDFASHEIARGNNLNSVLSILLYDELIQEVKGIMSIFSIRKEPMFNYHRRELVNLSKIATENLSKLIGIKRAKYIEERLEGIVTNGEVNDKGDIATEDNIELYLSYLSELSTIYDKGYFNYEDRSISIQDYENALLFRKNCKPYYLKKIKVNNINFFSNINWQFDKNINIILGNNGYGKSYLLRTIVSLLQNKSENLRQFFSKRPTQILSNVKLELIRNNFYHKEKNKICEIYFNEAGFEKSTDGIGKGIFPVLAIPDVRSARQSNSVGGVFGQLNGDLKKIGATAFLNREPFENFIEEFLNDLCLTYLDYNRKILKKGTLNPKEFGHYKFKLLKSVMDELTEDYSFTFHSIERVSNGSGFSFLVRTHDSNEIIPIQYVSQGTMSILAIFGLIYRYLEALYQNSKQDITELDEGLSFEDLTKLKGVVIIDELDAHLHPNWQQKIVLLLQKYFSNIQFFISAHSPLIVAGSKKGQVSILVKNLEKKFEIQTILNDFVGVKPSEIYDIVFKIEDYDLNYINYLAAIPELKRKEARFNELKYKNNLTEVEQDEFVKLDEDLTYIYRLSDQLKNYQ